jgi:pimeloyl-[acyl-carrier protein] methyl ester esterase
MTAQPLPLVFLPGLDGTARLRAGLVDVLRRTRPVTLMAYPDDPSLDYAALDGFVRARLPEGRFVVIGESFSGPVAIRLAQIEADRVVGLILLSTFARNPWPRWFAYGVPWLKNDHCPDAALAWVMLGGHAPAEQRTVLAEVAARLPKQVLQARSKAALSIDVSADLAACRCPLLCLSGRRDWLIQSRSAAHIRRLRPDGKFVMLDGAHNLSMTHIGEISAQIDKFFSVLPV